MKMRIEKRTSKKLRIATFESLMVAIEKLTQTCHVDQNQDHVKVATVK